MAAVLDSTSIDQWFSTEGSIAPTGDICQCLEIFLVITIGKGCYWYLVAETRDDAKHRTSYNAQNCPLQQRIIWPKMSIVPKLRNPCLDHVYLPLTMADP